MRHLLIFLALSASAQNFTNNSSGVPISRVSFLRSACYSTANGNFLGDPAIAAYFPMTPEAGQNLTTSGAVACDASGNKNVATYSGNFSSSYSGKVGAFAPYFSHNTPQSVFNVPAISSVSGAYTIIVWVKPNLPVTTSYPRIVESVYSSGFFVGGDNTGKYVSVEAGKFSPAGGTVSSGFPSNAWVMLASVYDGSSSVTLYVNGSSIGTTTGASAPTATNSIGIGYCSTSGASGCTGSSGAWDGLIQGVEIINRAYSSAEIAAKYAAENR